MNSRDLLIQALRIRRAEELLLEGYKQGLIKGTIHTCLGQELIPVIAREILNEAFWFSNHRGHGHYLAKTNDYLGLFAEILGREGAICRGIGGSQHIFAEGYMSNGVQGGQAGIAAGVASPRGDLQRISVMFIGDGTLGAGHLYESWNIAALENSRVLYVIEDNGVAQSTPRDLVFRGSLEQRAIGFGLEYLHVGDDGIEGLIHGFRMSRNLVEQGRPTVLHISTKRLGPHSKSDDNRNPVEISSLFSKDLLSISLERGEISREDEEVKEVEGFFETVKERPLLTLESNSPNVIPLKHNEIPRKQISLKMQINFALHQLMKEIPNLLMIGEDILDDPFNSGATYGGAFKVTTGLSSLFPGRIHPMPISESGFTGYALGLALSGNPIIVEVMFGDFLTQNIDQVVHQAVKIPSMYGKEIPIPILIRTAVGGGNGYGPTHSSYPDSFLLSLPDLIVLSINQFTDYFGLIQWAITTGKPTIVLEPKGLYSETMFPTIYSEYQEASHSGDTFKVFCPIYQNASLTLIVQGVLSKLVLDCLKELAEKYEIFVEVLIPEILIPNNGHAVIESLRKTGGRLLIIEESLNGFGFGAYLLGRVLPKSIITRFKYLYPTTWAPNGLLENQFIHNKNFIVESIRGFMSER